MPSPLGEGQTDMTISRHYQGEVLHIPPETVFHSLQKVIQHNDIN